MRTLKPSQIAVRCRRRRQQMRKLLSRSKKTCQTDKTKRIFKKSGNPVKKKKWKKGSDRTVIRSRKKRRNKQILTICSVVGNKTAFKPPRLLIKDEDAKSCFQKMLDYTSSVGDPTESFSCNSTLLQDSADQRGLEGLPKPQINQFIGRFQRGICAEFNSRNNVFLLTSEKVDGSGRNLSPDLDASKRGVRCGDGSCVQTMSRKTRKAKTKRRTNINNTSKKQVKTRKILSQKTGFALEGTKRKTIRKCRPRIPKGRLESQELRNLTLRSFDLGQSSNFSESRVNKIDVNNITTLGNLIQAKGPKRMTSCQSLYLGSKMGDHSLSTGLNAKVDNISVTQYQTFDLKTNPKMEIQIKNKLKTKTKSGLKKSFVRKFKEDSRLEISSSASKIIKSGSLENEESKNSPGNKNQITVQTKIGHPILPLKLPFPGVKTRINDFFPTITRLKAKFGTHQHIFQEDIKKTKLSSQIQNSEDSKLALQIPTSNPKQVPNGHNPNLRPVTLSKNPNSKPAHNHWLPINFFKKDTPITPIKPKPKPIDFEIMKLKGQNSLREERFKVYVNESDVLKIDQTFRAQWSKTECINRSIDDDCVTEDEHITYSLNRTFRYFCKYLRHNKKISKY